MANEKTDVKRQKFGIKIEIPDFDELPKSFIYMAVASIILMAGIMFFLLMEILGKDIFI